MVKHRIGTQAGIILVIVLIFIFLLSLLVLAGMDIAFVQTKLSQNNYYQHYTFEAAEAGLIQAENSLQRNPMPACLLVQPTELREQTTAWWQQQCQGRFPATKLYYIIEPLAFKPCIKVGMHDKRFLAYYQLSSYAIAKVGGAPVILQAIYTHISTESCRKTNKQTFTLGRIAWVQIK
jgi:Tfp pilus assembly protein PilX